ncbi:MAG: amino acid adenylation domain-containing protein [Candidatus Solibacter sp.]
MVQEQAAIRPDATAVWCGEDSLTYHELNRRANRIAHFLKRLGVGPAAPVGVLLDRGIDLIVSLLGILKADAAYLPLDPTYPTERLCLMVEDAGARVIITQGSLRNLLPADVARIVSLAGEAARIAREPETDPGQPASPDQLAYVIYTSGSTGKPKGIAVSHRSVQHLLSVTRPLLRLSNSDTWTVVHSTSFDFSVWEIWGALVNGAALVVVPLSIAQSPLRLAELLRKRKVTIFSQTPAALRQMVRETTTFSTVRIVICGGEGLPQDMVAPLIASGAEVWNFYGPTEATVWASCKQLEANDASYPFAPIGRPIPGNTLWVLDAELRQAKPGEAGELHIGGPNLAVAYYGRPEWTAEQFIPNPFGEPGSRLYRSGDSARMLPNGDLEFLGRLDHQVKIRGFRIELGEIEACLRRHPVVDEVVVVASPGPSDQAERSLSAYVTPQFMASSATPDLIRQWQTVHEETYRRTEKVSEPTFNIIGWNSSYDGLPIPSDQMREWVECTAQRIVALHPKRVLEIGCGTGMLLFRLAPQCEEYVGTDFSPTVLDTLRNEVSARGLTQVELQRREAADFENLGAGRFDTIVLNSVVQYFPSIEYLMEIIAKALNCLAVGGKIFLGDLRSLPLLSALYSSVEFKRAADPMPASELRDLVLARVDREEELVMDPEFFTALCGRLPRLGRAWVQPKRGRYHNELSLFRFDVVLTTDESVPAAPAMDRLDWDEQQLTLDEIKRRVQEEPFRDTEVKNVPNARLQSIVMLNGLLMGPECPDTAGDLRAALLSAKAGVDPEDLWQWGARSPYDVSIQCSVARPDCFDVVFQRRGSTLASAGNSEVAATRPVATYANRPLRRLNRRELTKSLRSHVEEFLPGYMRPSAYVFLDRFPLTPNGKVDRGRLPAPEAPRADVFTRNDQPQTAAEKVIAKIWGETLGLDYVGRGDNFFADLGGHSLSAMRVVSRMREEFQIDLPLRSFFDFPTVESAAKFFEDITTAEPA